MAEMAYCIDNAIQHRCSGELSLHVLDIIQAIMRAAESRTVQHISTSVQKAKPFLNSEIEKILK